MEIKPAALKYLDQMKLARRQYWARNTSKISINLMFIIAKGTSTVDVPAVIVTRDYYPAFCEKAAEMNFYPSSDQDGRFVYSFNSDQQAYKSACEECMTRTKQIISAMKKNFSQSRTEVVERDPLLIRFLHQNTPAKMGLKVDKIPDGFRLTLIL